MVFDGRSQRSTTPLVDDLYEATWRNRVCAPDREYSLTTACEIGTPPFLTVKRPVTVVAWPRVIVRELLILSLETLQAVQVTWPLPYTGCPTGLVMDQVCLA